MIPALVDIGPCRLYLRQQGAGTPAVIFESGIAASSLSWTYVQPQVAEFTCACSYDRAGLGWSTACRSPRTAIQLTLELRTLLAKANIEAPYILVGHSFGGLVARVYAHLHPEEVAGLVLVDPVSIQHWGNCTGTEACRLAYGVRLSRRGAILARFGIVRLALLLLVKGARRLPKLIARASAGRGTSALERIIGEVRKLPPEVYPSLRRQWSQSKSFQSMASHLEALPANASEALQMPVPPAIPLTVLSAASASREELEERELWAQQSERGMHIHLESCGHWLHLERPDVVTAAIRTMVEDVSRHRIDR